jgi:hypothetical protein
MTIVFSISYVLNIKIIYLQNIISRTQRLHCNVTIISILVAFTNGWKEVNLALSVPRYVASIRNYFT